MGHVDRFEIIFDNEQGVFHEGDRVSGHVEIVNSENVKYKVIRIDLCGIAVVCWNSFDDKDISVHDPDDVKGDLTKEQYFEKIVLLQKDGNFMDKDPLLPAGEHSFPFDCKLPLELPSSFEGQFGRVRYLAKAIIERATWKSNVVCKRAFTVVSGLDLNFIPESATKIEICKYKELGLCCTEGSVTIDWAVNRSGYVPGEDILIHGSIQNDSKQMVSCSSVTLYMVVEYKSKKRRKRERRKIAEAEKGVTVTDDVTVWNDVLHIPPVPPTGLGRCKLIDVSYELEFKAVIEGGYSPVIHTKDIYVGTVPLCMKEMKSCAAGMFNRPYLTSVEELLDGVGRNRKAGSQVSLTEILAAAVTAASVTNPSAPSLAVLETGEMGTESEILLTSAEDRPPPFAPGHEELPPESPSAPSAQSLQRPWTSEECPMLNPSYEASSVFGPVSLREQTDDTDSLKGDLTFHPLYPYYGTLGTSAWKSDDADNN